MSNAPLVRADFHMHTHHSYDSLTTPEQLVARCLEVGLGCIAVTDHNTIRGAQDVARIAPFPRHHRGRGQVHRRGDHRPLPAGGGPCRPLAPGDRGAHTGAGRPRLHPPPLRFPAPFRHRRPGLGGGPPPGRHDRSVQRTQRVRHCQPEGHGGGTAARPAPHRRQRTPTTPGSWAAPTPKCPCSTAPPKASSRP